MPIAFDNSAADVWVSGTTLTTAFTCTGSDLVLTVWICTVDNGTQPAVTGVTYNGVALTEVVTKNLRSSHYTQGFALAGPATGSHNVVVTWADVPNSSATVLFASYTGCASTGIPDSTASFSSASASSATITFTTIKDNCWLVGAGDAFGNAMTAGTNTLKRQAGTGNRDLFDSNGAQTPAGSHALNYTASAGQELFTGLALAPAPPTITTSALTNTSDDFSFSLTRPIADSLAMVTAAATSFAYFATLADALGLSTALVTATNYIRTLLDIVTMTTTFSQHGRWTPRTPPTTPWTDHVPPTTPWTDHVPPTTNWTPPT